MNGSFYRNAFSEEEKSMIQRIITSHETSDHVFCLSAEEARAFFVSDEDRVAEATSALVENGYRVMSWWTRSISTATNGKGVVEVESDGNVRSAGCVPDYKEMGVRPCICVDFKGNSPENLNLVMFGIDSNTDLDNEPDILQRIGSGGQVCAKCGHPAQYLASNGYCKTCVDVYCKEYYVNIFGVVVPDR